MLPGVGMLWKIQLCFGDADVSLNARYQLIYATEAHLRPAQHYLSPSADLLFCEACRELSQQEICPSWENLHGVVIRIEHQHLTSPVRGAVHAFAAH